MSVRYPALSPDVLRSFSATLAPFRLVMLYIPPPFPGLHVIGYEGTHVRGCEQVRHLDATGECLVFVFGNRQLPRCPRSRRLAVYFRVLSPSILVIVSVPNKFSTQTEKHSIVPVYYFSALNTKNYAILSISLVDVLV